jgi:hypothetical protein
LSALWWKSDRNVVGVVLADRRPPIGPLWVSDRLTSSARRRASVGIGSAYVIGKSSALPRYRSGMAASAKRRPDVGIVLVYRRLFIGYT